MWRGKNYTSGCVVVTGHLLASTPHFCPIHQSSDQNLYFSSLLRLDQIRNCKNVGVILVTVMLLDFVLFSTNCRSTILEAEFSRFPLDKYLQDSGRGWGTRKPHLYICLIKSTYFLLIYGS